MSRVTPDAPRALKAQRDDVMGEGRDPYCLPLALNRSEEAFAYLVDVVRTEPPARVGAALNALAIFAADEPHRQVIADAVESRADTRISVAFSAEFDL